MSRDGSLPRRPHPKRGTFAAMVEAHERKKPGKPQPPLRWYAKILNVHPQTVRVWAKADFAAVYEDHWLTPDEICDVVNPGSHDPAKTAAFLASLPKPDAEKIAAHWEDPPWE